MKVEPKKQIDEKTGKVSFTDFDKILSKKDRKIELMTRENAEMVVEKKALQKAYRDLQWQNDEERHKTLQIQKDFEEFKRNNERTGRGEQVENVQCTPW